MQNESNNPAPAPLSSTSLNNLNNTSNTSTTSSSQNSSSQANNGQLVSSNSATASISSTITAKNSVNSSSSSGPTPATKFHHLDRFIEDYGKGDLLGEGTYGQVFKATHKDTKQIVAIKKIKVDKEKDLGFPVTAIREILILKSLNHKNIVKLQEVVCSKDLKKNHFYMVFEYIEHDLAGLVYEKVMFTEANIKHFMKQLLEALFVCHAGNILHRDLKSSNLLIDKDGTLKLADFGLARLVSKDIKRGLTPGNRIVTLWYRPPECLLVSNQYDSAVDIWSAGCILAELLIGRPIFQGKKETELLETIWKICGTPEPSNSLCSLPAYQDFSPKESWKRNLKETILQSNPRTRAFSSQLFDLLDKMLELDPKKRISAHECLDHAWFFDVKCPAQPPASLPPIRCSEMTAKERKKKEHQWGLSANHGGSSIPPHQPSGTSVPHLQPLHAPIQQVSANQPNSNQSHQSHQDRHHPQQGGYDRHHDGRKPYHHHNNRGNYQREGGNYYGQNNQQREPRSDQHHHGDGHHRGNNYPYRRDQQHRDQSHRDQPHHPSHHHEQPQQHVQSHSSGHSSSNQTTAPVAASSVPPPQPASTASVPVETSSTSHNVTVSNNHSSTTSQQQTSSQPPPPPPGASHSTNPPPPPSNTSSASNALLATPQGSSTSHHHHRDNRDSRDNRDRGYHSNTGRRDSGRDFRDDRGRDSGRDREFRDNGPNREYRERPETRERSDSRGDLPKDRERESREGKEVGNNNSSRNESTREHRVESRERSDSRDYSREPRYSTSGNSNMPNNNENPSFKRQKTDSGYYERREGRNDDYRDDDYRRREKHYNQPRNGLNDRKPEEKRDSRK